MSNKRILIIEDSPDVAEMLRMYFVSRQYEVFHADTGPLGVEMARLYFPNLILLDVMLPEMDGYEVCRNLRIKSLTRYIPIIFLTQRDERASRVKGLELGADDYITKPFDVEELRLRVRNAIDAATRDNLHEIRTGLPTGSLVEEEFERRQKADEKTVALRCTIERFRSYVDVYGFMAGNEVLEFAARGIREALRNYGTTDDFIGIDVDDFVIFTNTDNIDALQDHIRNSFNDGVRPYYTFADAERGGVIVKISGTEATELVPLMSLKVIKQEH